MLIRRKTLLLLLFPVIAYSQSGGVHALRYKLLGGDREALQKIAPYLDSRKEISDMLGYHLHSSEERQIALRIISETCLFTMDEISIDSNLTASKWKDFLEKNSSRIVFSEETGAFLITPFEKRQTRYWLRKLSETSIDSFNRFMKEHPYPQWVYTKNIDYYIKLKDPKCLVLIASDFLRKRSMWNIYDFNDNDYIQLLGGLTHLEFAVPDGSEKVNFLYNLTDTDKRLNLLVYFATHINDYKWDEKEKIFINSKEIARPISVEEHLFQLLDSPDDSVALNAFARLTESDPVAVSLLADEYEKSGVRDYNYSLPTFPYRFLRQMSALVDYCRKNNITYKASGVLLKQLDSLREDISYKKRYEIENNVISYMTPGDITSVEYYSLLHESGFWFTHSAGRILDKSYSRLWNQIITDRKQLNIYLKKTVLFDNIGIIGTCNNYKLKLTGSSPATIELLNQVAYEEKDQDIGKLVHVDLRGISKASKKTWPKIFTGESRQNYPEPNLEVEWRKILRSSKEKDDKRYDLLKLISKISYRQIGKTLELLKKDTLLEHYERYNFLEDDFGFWLDSVDEKTINAFHKNYLQLSEKELYTRHLLQDGFNIFDSGKKPDYQKIYDILKYDIVQAFVGGGGGRRDDHVYAVIKLLEMELGNRFNAPVKACNSRGIYSCSLYDLAISWMNLLEEEKFVTIDPNEPPSFSVEN